MIPELAAHPLGQGGCRAVARTTLFGEVVEIGGWYWLEPERYRYAQVLVSGHDAGAACPGEGQEQAGAFQEEYGH